MERSSLRKSLKDHSIGSKSSNNNNKLKDSWNYNSQSSGYGSEDYLVGGFSWPPRSYTCSFCKREFRSAQALGGHMNVHRRDRARLRQSPPPTHHCPTILNLNLSPNPNPSFSTSTTSLTCTFPSLVPPQHFPSSSPFFVSPSTTHEAKKWGGSVDHGSTGNNYFSSPRVCSDLKTMEGSRQQSFLANPAGEINGGKDFMTRQDDHGCNKLLKKGEIIRLDLEIGTFVSDDHSKEDLDLELRLGYS